MWGHILNRLLPLWRETKWGIPNFYDTLGDLVPELTNMQRASVRQEIWEYWLIPEHHYSVPWKFLPEELFSVAWHKLENIREDDIGRFVEHIVPYIPYEMLPSIEIKLETLVRNTYAQQRLPRIKAALIHRNLHLSQIERKNAYLKLVREYIDRSQLTDLLKCIPQELTLQIWMLKLTDYRNFRLNNERRRNYGPYRIEETLYLLIDRMPAEDVSEAIDCLLDEVFIEDTLYASSLDPKATSELCGALVKCLSAMEQKRIAEKIVKKVEVITQHELENQSEENNKYVFPTLYGYFIALLDVNIQEDYWKLFFEFTASLQNRLHQALCIVEHLEHYPVDQRLTKWHEAWQIVNEKPASHHGWILKRVIASVPLAFGEQKFIDKTLALDLAQKVLQLEDYQLSDYKFDKTWFGFALMAQAFDSNTAQLVYKKFISRRVDPIMACALMPFLTPEQIDTLLVYQKDFTGVMYFLDERLRHSLALVIAQWSGSISSLVWSRSLDSIEQFISDSPDRYHPDYFMVWLRLIAQAIPNYDVVAAWKHLLDHRGAFWFNAWQELGAILIEHLQPVSDEEAIRVIWRDIQDIGKDTATLQSAIAPKLPTDIVSKMRTQFTSAPLPPKDVFICSLPTYIFYGGGPQINSFFEYDRWWKQQNGRTSNKINRFAELVIWLIAIVNFLLYPVVYLYMAFSKITEPVHRYLLLGIMILLFPILLVFSIVEQTSYRVSRFITTPFGLMQSLVRGVKEMVAPVVEIVKVHQLPKAISEHRFADLLSKADLSDFASARPLLQRIGGSKLRYAAHRAYHDALEWWADATIEK